MKVEWDENKHISTLRDHGVDFQDAALIFPGPVIEADDARLNYGEQRRRALGHFNGDYFMVAYTWSREFRARRIPANYHCMEG